MFLAFIYQVLQLLRTVWIKARTWISWSRIASEFIPTLVTSFLPLFYARFHALQPPVSPRSKNGPHGPVPGLL